MFGELAMGSLQLADQLKGMAEWDKAHQDGTLDKWTDRQVNQNYNISKNAENDGEKYNLDPEEANANLDRTVRFSSRYAQNKFVDWVKENKEALRQDVKENWEKARGDKGQDSFEYGEASAITAMDLGARALLRDLGIGEGTKAGKEIIEQFRLWGSLDQEGYYKARKVEETTARIDDIYTEYKAFQMVKRKNFFLML